ncbi:MAG: class I SAM-dependent methyltransferase [Planctomycetota bacterium]
MEANAYRQFLELERDHFWFRGRRSVYFGLLEHELRTSAPRRILDLGCGMGGFLDGLSKLGGRVFHSDVDIDSLRHCTERGFPNGVVSSGYSLPYRDEAFDLVCMFDAIEHIPDDEAVMREVARVLRPGGHIFVSVPAYQFLYANNDRVAQHERRYTRGMLRRVFEQAGLEVVRNTHSNIFLFPAILTPNTPTSRCRSHAPLTTCCMRSSPRSCRSVDTSTGPPGTRSRPWPGARIEAPGLRRPD